MRKLLNRIVTNLFLCNKKHPSLHSYCHRLKRHEGICVALDSWDRKTALTFGKLP